MCEVIVYKESHELDIISDDWLIVSRDEINNHCWDEVVHNWKQVNASIKKLGYRSGRTIRNMIKTGKSVAKTTWNVVRSPCVYGVHVHQQPAILLININNYIPKTFCYFKLINYIRSF